MHDISLIASSGQARNNSELKKYSPIPARDYRCDLMSNNPFDQPEPAIHTT
jgi:hypothetical protein